LKDFQHKKRSQIVKEDLILAGMQILSSNLISVLVFKNYTVRMECITFRVHENRI
jgi:glucose uptake protein GlcU